MAEDQFYVFSETSNEWLDRAGTSWTADASQAGSWNEERADKRAEVMIGGKRSAVSLKPVGEAAPATPFEDAEQDPMAEAQRIIGGLLDLGFQTSLVERARRWLEKAEAGRLGEPLYGLALDLVGDLDDLMDHSDGVYGLHENGDPSPWGELTRGGRFEDWLSSFDRMRDHLRPGGRCRVCGCTRVTACSVETADGSRACGWTDDAMTLCDNPACVAADAARRSFEPNPDHTAPGGMRRSIHRSHRGEGFNHVD